jgi:hypothetical protein
MPRIVDLSIFLRSSLNSFTFDPPLSNSFSFQQLTISKIHTRLYSAPMLCLEKDQCHHPALRQVVSTWTLCGGWLAPRRANEGYTTETAVSTRLVCQAYHRHPGRTTCRPPCLNSLTPDARRGEPLCPGDTDVPFLNASNAAPG